MDGGEELLQAPFSDVETKIEKKAFVRDREQRRETPGTGASFHPKCCAPLNGSHLMGESLESREVSQSAGQPELPLKKEANLVL